MAFSSQSFKAPKIKKGNFSSPLSSGAVKTSTSAPKLKATKISFIKKENSPIVEAVNNNAESLTQTNEILIEIQKQLAFDFANRIAEEKDAIKKIKAAESRRRFGEEEKAVEGTNKIKKGLFGAFDKVMAPAKGIFDKLLDFFSIVLTGFIANKAFDWLKNKENRDKITGILNWIGKNWKLLVGLFVVGKLLGPIGLLIKFGRLLAKLFKRGGGLGPDRLKRAKNLSADCGSLLKSLAKCINGGLGKAFITAIGGGLIGSGFIPKPGDKPGDDTVDTPSLTQQQVDRDNERYGNTFPGGSFSSYNLGQLLSKTPGTYTPEEEKFLIDQGLDDFVKGSRTQATGVDAIGLIIAAALGLAAPGLLGSSAAAPAAVTAPATGAAGLTKIKPSQSVAQQMLTARQRALARGGSRGVERSTLTSRTRTGKEIRQRQDEARLRNAETDPSLQNLDEAVKFERLMKKGFKLYESTGVEGGVRSLSAFLAPIIPFILPPVQSQPTPKPAPVATQTVSIDAVDRNNMYRRTTPNIYGMGVFAF